MSWLYKGHVFKDEHIPVGAVGFVYQMTAIIGNQSISYIGKKNFYANKKKKLGKKKLPTDKRKKTYERVAKLSYHDYYSSNEVLKQAHRSGALIRREILKICFSKNQLTYEEVKYQFVMGVLESQEFLNGNILGRFYKGKI